MKVIKHVIMLELTQEDMNGVLEELNAIKETVKATKHLKKLEELLCVASPQHYPRE